jgi:hypothetical protein
MRRQLGRISARIQHGGSSLSFRSGRAFPLERTLSLQHVRYASGRPARGTPAVIMVEGDRIACFAADCSAGNPSACSRPPSLVLEMFAHLTNKAARISDVVDAAIDGKSLPLDGVDASRQQACSPLSQPRNPVM